jgi:hypothetical protein
MSERRMHHWSGVLLFRVFEECGGRPRRTGTDCSTASRTRRRNCSWISLTGKSRVTPDGAIARAEPSSCRRRAWMAMGAATRIGIPSSLVSNRMISSTRRPSSATRRWIPRLPRWIPGRSCTASRLSIHFIGAPTANAADLTSIDRIECLLSSDILSQILTRRLNTLYHKTYFTNGQE